MLEISTRQLPMIKPSILAKAINKLEDVRFLNSEMTEVQAQAIFATMGDDTKLKRYQIIRQNLSMIQPAVFGKGLSKLEEASLRNCNVTREQVIALFLAISKGGQLKKLDLSFNNLSSVEPFFLARGVNMLQEVDLTRSSLTSDQIHTIFRVFLEEETRIEKLSMELSDLFKANPELVRQVTEKFATEKF